MNIIEKLKNVLPESVYNELPSVMEKFGINTPLRLAHFLGQCSHESGGFKLVRENLNYSAEGLLKTFPKYFTKEKAIECARQPSKIANIVYANRMGNDTTNGFLYSGKGYIQITGKNNVVAFDKFVDEDLVTTPDLIANKYPLLSAGWYFSINNINAISDKGIGLDVIKAVTKKVNGGYIGLDDRITKTNYYYDLLK